MFTRVAWISIVGLLLSTQAFAARGGGGGGGIGGGYSLGIALGTISSSQAQMNELIKRANTREGGISNSELTSAYEAAVDFRYRFSGTIYALQLRPSFFYQQSTGSGSGGSFKYGLTGFTLFPMLRLYPLENEFMKFFMQFGLGYGRVNGSIVENNAAAPGNGTVDFAGGAFGTVVGLGAEFCMTPNHCFTFEGNYRYLTYARVLATSSSGSFDSTSGSLSQYGKNQEVELDGEDLNLRMGGLQFLAGYALWF